VGIIEEDKTSGEDASGKTVARFPHDKICDRDSQSTKSSGESSVRDIGNFIRNVGVADVLEVEVTIVANEPADKGEQKLAEGRVDVEKVGSLEVV
jgi:hypothetical protein